GVAGDHRATVAPAAEVLGRVEAEAGSIAEGADRAALVKGAMSLAGVLDHEDGALAAELEDRVDLDRAAEKVDRDHAAGALGQRRLDDLFGDHRGLGIDVDDHRGGADG